MNATTPLHRAGAALFGPVVWAGHFLVIYVSESLACRSNQPMAHNAVVLAATVFAGVALILHLSLAYNRAREIGGEAEAERFFRRTSYTLDALSLVGVGWTAMAAILLAACK
jgi:hypothetical protein